MAMVKHGIDLDSPAMRDLCRKWKIKELAVFGFILREDFRPDSDIDFLVEYEPDEDMDMKDELGAILRRNVDLVSRAAIESSDNPYLRTEILGTAELASAKR